MGTLSSKETRELSLWRRVYAAVEHVIVTYLVPLKSPGPIWRWVFKVPILFYRVGLGPLIGARVLILHTVGRKTGKQRLTPLEYDYDADTDTYTVMAGWGGKTDWYRNARANPRVLVRVGRRAFEANAERLAREKVAQVMVEMVRANPGMLRVFSRWAEVPLDGSLERLYDTAAYFPMLTLRPIRASETTDV